MPILKIERYWPKEVKEIATNLSEELERGNTESAVQYLNKLLEILKDRGRDGKSRVSVCFIIARLKHIEPFFDRMVNALKEVLEQEEDAHVKEFAVWSLGQLVEESMDIGLIKETLPIFIKFCNDTSEHVKRFAEDIKDRLNDFLKEHESKSKRLKEMLGEFKELVEVRIAEMKERARILSQEALELDYKAAFERRTEFEERIREFKELNAEAEDEIIALREKFIRELPLFKSESRELMNYWRELRGEKEALIRRIHCILRIQGKIYRIIMHIKRKSDGKIDLKELKEETSYSDAEIIEILKKLVDEEIIPTFILDQIGNREEKKQKLD